MDQLEAVRQPLGFEHFTRHHQVGRAEAKLRILAPTRCPFTGALAVQPHPDADERLDPHFFRDPEGLLELFQFLDHDDDGLAEAATEHGGANKSAILVAITNDEALGILVHRERGDEFRFAPGFETEMKLRARIDDLFDDFS